MIDDNRLLETLHELRAIGRCGNGVVRPAFSAEDIQARRWLAAQLAQCGLLVHIDPAGNVFGLPPGNEPCLLLGSHTDTQPEGGWLDGALGVVAALEIARSRRERAQTPIAVVSFQDEEGRFGSTTGSMIWSGQLSLQQADALLDADGLSFAQARAGIAAECAQHFIAHERFSGFLEMHIEQGPFLIDSDDIVGVVDKIVGVRQYRYLFTGEQNHAGTTPMPKRRDAFRALAQLSAELDDVLEPLATTATVWTIGQVKVSPNAPSIVPGGVEFTLQWRDSDEPRLEQMAAAIDALVTDIAARFDIQVDGKPVPRVNAAAMDDALCAALQQAAIDITDNRYRRMPSAAIHDAGIVSQVLPCAMLFVPSIGGISHNFAEDSHTEHLTMGTRVLADAVHRLTDG